MKAPELAKAAEHTAAKTPPTPQKPPFSRVPPSPRPQAHGADVDRNLTEDEAAAISYRSGPYWLDRFLAERDQITSVNADISFLCSRAVARHVDLGDIRGAVYERRNGERKERWWVSDPVWFPRFKHMIAPEMHKALEGAYQDRMSELRDKYPLYFRDPSNGRPQSPKMTFPPAKDLRDWLYDAGVALSVTADDVFEVWVQATGELLNDTGFSDTDALAGVLLGIAQAKHETISCPYRTLAEIKGAIRTWYQEETLNRPKRRADLLDAQVPSPPRLRM